jgi:fructosamine-3-kinase
VKLAAGPSSGLRPRPSLGPNTVGPSLGHAVDLWNGNFICDAQSRPVLIDPAVYYVHRSTDPAMTSLFGGFEWSFYESYPWHFPLPANHQGQWDICNLSQPFWQTFARLGYIWEIFYTQFNSFDVR